MSRLLKAGTVARLQTGIFGSGKAFFNKTCNLFAAKKTPSPPPKATPPKASKTNPKCKPDPPPKPKPGYFPSGGMHAVFSDLPKPEGDFMKAWAEKNSKCQIFMLSGLLALIGSLVLSYMTLELNASVPEYPYTEEEIEDFEIEKERIKEEEEAREQRHQDAVDARERAKRARKAKEAMFRESELMNHDLEGEGISDKEALELKKLAEDREAYNEWEKEETKRREEILKEREEVAKERAKVRAERQKERDKKRKEREKQLEKEEAEREKVREKSRKEREKARKEEEKKKAQEKAEREKAKKAQTA